MDFELNKRRFYWLISCAQECIEKLFYILYYTANKIEQYQLVLNLSTLESMQQFR